MIAAVALAIKAILVISFLASGVYFVGTGAMFSCGGFIGWIFVSAMLTILLTILLSPLILLAGLVGAVLRI